MDSMEYTTVFKEDRGALSHGKFKVSPTAIYFKNSKTGKVEHIKSEEIKDINWQRIALEYGIRISLKNGLFHRFGGFHDYDFEKLSKYCEENYRLNLKQKDICLKGYNWGVANFNGSLLSFDQEKDKATCFEIPLTNVSHCTSAKNEVTLEFHQNDDAPVSLMEIRFHIPTNPDGPIDDPVQAFMDAVNDKASIIQATGESIATFTELQCLTPRGRYDIKIFPTFIQLHGKTFDYKIPLTTILRLFRLPHKDQRQVFFVLSLDPPIKQGQTRYQFLILLFNKEEEITLDVTLSDELKEKYEGKLEETMSGSTVEVLGQIMKVLVQRKITLPGIQGTPNQAITCSYKAQSGYLYPLERGFIFIHKPPVHIRFDEITAINFARSGGSTKSFDFEIETKAGILHTFSSIEKDEYSKLYDFVSSKNLRVKNRGTEKQTADVDDDIVDSDMEEGEPDAYLQRVKNEGKLREQDSEDDESEDEDFAPGEESDVEEEYDSDAKGSDSSDDDYSAGGAASDDSSAKRKKKQKSSKEKKHKKDKSSKKSSKDDDKPKRPQTAFFLWFNDTRSSIKSKYPELSLTEISKKAGELWKEKSAEDKAVWERKAVKAKEEYQRQMEEYESKGSSSKGDKSSKKSKESKNESPKKVNKSQPFKSKEYISDSSSSAASEQSDQSDKSDQSEESEEDSD